MHRGGVGVAELGAEAGADASGRGPHPPVRRHARPGLKTTTLGSTRSQLYEEQVTGVPIEYSYYVGGKEFDGFNGFALIDAKGPGYAFRIKSDWSKEPFTTPERYSKTKGKMIKWTARCFSDSACFVLQAAFFRSRNSLSTSSGVRYPRAE